MLDDIYVRPGRSFSAFLDDFFAWYVTYGASELASQLFCTSTKVANTER